MGVILGRAEDPGPGEGALPYGGITSTWIEA
jgi:hypothetical protein